MAPGDYLATHDAYLSAVGLLLQQERDTAVRASAMVAHHQAQLLLGTLIGRGRLNDPRAHEVYQRTPWS